MSMKHVSWHARVGITVLVLAMVACAREDYGSFGDEGASGAVIEEAGGGQVGDDLSSSSNSPSLSAGWSHACTLFAGGRVLCWGTNYLGQLGSGTTIPEPAPVLVTDIASATAVASGYEHACALLTGGTVKCWGDNFFGQLGNGTTTNSSTPVTVSGIATATAIAGGGHHTCTRLSDSTVKCWGSNVFGALGNNSTTDSSTPVAVYQMTTATGVAGGFRHTCARLSNSTLKCWGLNSSGQLGNGKTVSSPKPVAVSNISTATAVAAGAGHSCARLSDSTLRCWGRNGNGQLGNNTTTDSKTPVAVSGISTAAAIAAGDNHGCAHLSDATLKCWGSNNYGQLGNNTTTDAKTPVAVSGIAGASEIAGGSFFTCARLSSGAVNCWGNNASGQAGQDTGSNHPVPARVQPLSLNLVLDVTSGGTHTCALWHSGALKCWGDNAYGQLGNGATTGSSTPIDVSAIATATAVAGGFQHTCARLSQGTVQCWGDNSRGQLGDGTWTTPRTTPVEVAGITTAAAIAAGGGESALSVGHACAVLNDGTAKCWGANRSGQLGDGTTTDSNTPVAVTGISAVVAMTAGPEHTCALLSDSTVKCWGKNGSGRLGDGTTTDSSTPVSVSGLSTATGVGAGEQHTCARLSDATVRCWGDNTYGQLGNGTTTGSTTPVAVSQVTTATSIAVGALHSCARLSDKTVKCWGRNALGSLGDGSVTDASIPVFALAVTGATAVDAGGNHTCARLSDSTVKCWGANGKGQLGNGYQAMYLTPQPLACLPVTVERSDYFVNYTTADMPDLSLNNLTASLDVHRVRPVYPAGCSAAKAMVLVPGRTIPASASYDLQYEDYSLMESLAMQGIDTFAANQVGLGFSKLTSSDPMTNACNGSKVACSATQCSPCTLACAQANNCDCPGLIVGLAGMGQQTSTRYLGGGHPLSSACAHPSPYHLQRVTHHAAELVYIVNDALSKNPGLSKVSLFGWAFGGVAVGKYLGDNVTYAGESMATRQSKVERIIFLSTPYAATAGQPLSSAESQPPTFPMAVIDKVDVAAGFNTPNTCLSGDGCQAQCRISGSTCVACAPGAQGCPTSEAGSCDPDCSCVGPECPCTTDDCAGCPGQLPAGMVNQIWSAVRLRDDNPASPPWGPASDYVARYPVVTRFAWHTSATTNIRNAGLPALIMHGKKDAAIDLQASTRLCAALNGGAACIQGQLTGPLLLMQPNCTSHSVPWEGCSGSTCNGWRGPHAMLAKNMADYTLTGMLYASPGSNNGVFSSAGNDGWNYHVAAPDEGTSCSCGGAECTACGDGICPCVDGVCEVCP